MLGELAAIIKSDLYRYVGTEKKSKMFHSVWSVPGARYLFFLRITARLRIQGMFMRPFYWLSHQLLKHYQYKYGIAIPYNTNIAPGCYLGHFGGIVIHPEVTIGKNCNINHGVTLGASYGGKYPGVPTILNDVYLGPGCKVIGGVSVGNHVAVGANCVVTAPVPDNAVIVGVPGEVISYKGSSSYVVNTI